MTKKHEITPDSCMACNSCMVYCPVTAATREFPGPKIIGPVLERFRRMGENAEIALDYCCNCRNCDLTCPSGVPVSTLNLLAKARYRKSTRASLGDWILSHGETMAKVASPIAPLANMGMAFPLSRRILKEVGITNKIPMPRYANRTFSRQFREFRQKSFIRKVVFYPGCFINYYDPRAGMDFVAVMQANEYQVIVPENWECCGSPLVVNGFLDEARNKAKNNIRELKQWTGKNIPVVTCCTSCGLMFKKEYQELFEIEGMTELAAHVYDSSEFLLELAGNGQLNMDFKPGNGDFLYHAPCHLRAQGIGRPSLELLQMIPGIQVCDIDAGCCGISGNYGFKKDRYDIAAAVGKELFKSIKARGVDTVLSDCGTCRLQIAHAAGVNTLHPVSIIKRFINE